MAWKALESVLCQTTEGGRLLDQLLRGRVAHSEDSVSESGEACGIEWEWFSGPRFSYDLVRLEGPLARLDWEFVATGE